MVPGQSALESIKFPTYPVRMKQCGKCVWTVRREATETILAQEHEIAILRTRVQFSGRIVQAFHHPGARCADRILPYDFGYTCEQLIARAWDMVTTATVCDHP